MTKQEYLSLRQKIEEKCRADIQALDRVWQMSVAYGEVPPDLEESPTLPESPSRPALVRKGDRLKFGNLTKAIEHVLPDMPEMFSWMEVRQQLRKVYPDQAFKETSVRQAVARLAELNVISLVSLGAGRARTIYKLLDGP